MPRRDLSGPDAAVLPAMARAEPTRPSRGAQAGVLFLQPGRVPPAVVREAKPEDDTRREEPVAVWLHNDDYTPADYVVGVLQEEFALGWWKANWTMLKAHVSGRAPVGRYARAEAETRVAAATERARSDGWPLRMTLDETP